MSGPMRATTLIAATAVAAFALAACSNPNGGKSGGHAGACTPFPEAANSNNGQAAAAPSDPASALDDCLHRWGYTLAPSSDAAEAVAQASVAACASMLARWNQQGLTSGAVPQPAESAQEAPSLLNGQPTNPLAEHYTYAQGRALFYVVQARAGKCAPPATTAPQAPANPPTAATAPPAANLPPAGNATPY